MSLRVFSSAFSCAVALGVVMTMASCDVGKSSSDGGEGGDGGDDSSAGAGTGAGNTGTGNNGNTGGSGNTGNTGNTGGSTGSGTTTGSDTGLPPIVNGCNGYATRFWDCCKPHCGWKGNVPASMSPMTTCDKNDNNMGGNHDAQSSCNGGDAHTCHSLAPWAVNSLVAYGYAATSSGDICGRCYQIQFTGTSHNGGQDPGSMKLLGKAMIVQAINIGYDVGGHQFDLLTPGGGVGAFNACSSQWGVDSSELGKQYGGFLGTCKDQLGGDASHSALKSCVAQRCQNVFVNKGLTELAAGCQWFVDWFEVADNPNLIYEEVQCPQEIIHQTGMNRTPLNDIKDGCN